MTSNTLVVLGTGGTIAGRAASALDNVNYTAAQLGIDDLLGAVTPITGMRLDTEQVAQIDSKDMGPTVWRTLLARTHHHLQRPEVCGVVITHGTDTLEETAYLLQTVLNPAKPVVLVGAMRPATALAADGPQNLRDAMVVATQAGARGVVAVLAGHIHSALDVQKIHPYRLDAFSSGQSGPIGCVEEGRCTLWRAWPDTGDHHAGRLTRLLNTVEWPRVDWLSSHGGASGALVRALLMQRQAAMDAGAAVLGGADPLLRGLVIAGTGNGSLHQDLLSALLIAQAAGVAVRRCTRCAQGRVLVAGDPLPSLALPASKARLALMLELL